MEKNLVIMIGSSSLGNAGETLEVKLSGATCHLYRPRRLTRLREDCIAVNSR